MSTVASHLSAPPMRRSMVVAAQASTAEVVPEAKAQITNLLRRRHGLANASPAEARTPGIGDESRSIERSRIARSILDHLTVRQ